MTPRYPSWYLWALFVYFTAEACWDMYPIETAVSCLAVLAIVAVCVRRRSK